MKRIRVGNACIKCRELKAKCDGRQPICARCEGYGFRCEWAQKDRRKIRSTGKHSSATSREHQRSTACPFQENSKCSLLQAIESYESLFESLKCHLDSAQQDAANSKLSSIRELVTQHVYLEGRADVPSSSQGIDRNIAGSSEIAQSRAYVGKASEIDFIDKVRRCVGEEPAEEIPTQDYSQDHPLERSAPFKFSTLLPSRDDAEMFVSVYLSTIHIAYPFLSQSAVNQALEKFLARDIYHAHFRPWLAILNFIFAIGSYYTSFDVEKRSEVGTHFKYYQQGVLYSRELDSHREIMSVHILLVQSFFHLAVSLTERSWITLGSAIRIGQSIGLHVESDISSRHITSHVGDLSTRRRTWYSMYVLDRLLSLQLGRPVAIHDADFRVELPSKGDASAFGSVDDIQDHSSHAEQSHRIDYFIEVIRFSYVLGSVIRSLYQPSQVDSPPDRMLSSASFLDSRLTEWKLSLPRHLRFDLGHTFERSIIFKRQRNMLAVKYHHLRTLIHRPFLCMPFLSGRDPAFANTIQHDGNRILEAERICVNEATQTARLLHNVTDEQSLVHDFPWWQMISCLICAGSVLCVAATFGGSELAENSECSTERLKEDAGTCLQVFQALSKNSEAAQKAANMLDDLLKTRLMHGIVPPSCQPGSEIYAGGEMNVETNDSYDHQQLPSPEFSQDTASLWEWPGEIFNSMEWSLRFLDFPQGDQGGS